MAERGEEIRHRTKGSRSSQIRTSKQPLLKKHDKFLVGVFLVLWIVLQFVELQRLELCKNHISSNVKFSSPASVRLKPVVASRQSISITRKHYADCLESTSARDEAFCALDSQSIFYTPTSHPTVAVRDISVMRYFAQRDLQGWTIAFANLSFDVVEYQSKRSVPLESFQVLLCLGINLQEAFCIKKENYIHLGQGQRVNQIFNLRNILWKKDSFCHTMQAALIGLEATHSDFIFPCWVLPDDLPTLEPLMAKKTNDFIVKPSDRGEGHGIFVTKDYKELVNESFVHYVVQPLLPNPLLVEERKIDLRTYVLVTSILPLRAYIFKEGLVRFASTKYEQGGNDSKSEKSYLTNTSVGKKYTDLSNLTWTFAKLKSYIDTKTLTTSKQVFNAVNQVIAKTLLVSELKFAHEFSTDLDGYTCQHCYQLLGVDVILDSQFQPKVLEVNGLPSMQLSHELGVIPDPSSVYTATKYELMWNMLRIVLHPTDATESLMEDLQTLNVGLSPGPLCDPALHRHCIDRAHVKNLLHLKRELINSGGFGIIYPHPDDDLFKPILRHIDTLIRKGSVSMRNTRTNYHYHNISTAIVQLHELSRTQ